MRSRLRSRLVVVAALAAAGCASPNYKETAIHAPPQRSVPTFSAFDACLADVFSRGRMPSAKLEELYRAVESHLTASFEVPVEGFWGGPYLRRYFVSYLPGPQLLILGRIQKDKRVTEMRAWYVKEPRVLPAPITKKRVKPSKPSEPLTKCPKCGFDKIKPWHQGCVRCAFPFRKK